MTESQERAALNAAFPTEPLPERLKTRIENLTQLSPSATAYRFKFRHVLAAFAVLWIGHNIPTAIKLSRKWITIPTTHTRIWQKSGNNWVLAGEVWRQGVDEKMITYTPQRRVKTISFVLEKESYKYDPKKNLIIYTHMNPRIDLPGTKSSIRDALIEALPVLLLRTSDTRKTEIWRGKKVKVVQIGSSKSYFDPETELEIFFEMGHVRFESEYNVSLPKGFFEPNFPKDAQQVEKSEYGQPNQEHWKGRIDRWLSLYVRQPHP